jgi:hypothetical protein
MEVEELTGSETGLRTHSVFAHVLMKNAELYRAILEVFVQSREQFITHLRPLEVALSIGREQEEIENALRHQPSATALVGFCRVGLTQSGPQTMLLLGKNICNARSITAPGIASASSGFKTGSGKSSQLRPRFCHDE